MHYASNEQRAACKYCKLDLTEGKYICVPPPKKAQYVSKSARCTCVIHALKNAGFRYKQVHFYCLCDEKTISILRFWESVFLFLAINDCLLSSLRACSTAASLLDFAFFHPVEFPSRPEPWVPLSPRALRPTRRRRRTYNH